MSEGCLFPKVLTFTDLRSYLFSAAFILLAVAAPWAFHQYHLAGPTFLPMHIFVLLAGLMFGWRAGLAVGLFTPLVSHAITGMPVLAILPQILIELSVYGLVAGLLREKLNLRTVWSLAGAMIAGRLALVLAVAVLSLFGAVYSPLGAEAGPLAVAWSAVRQGWPGILMQLIFIPLVVILLGKWLAHEKPET